MTRNLFLEKLIDIVKNGKKLPDRVSSATFKKIPFRKQMTIKKEGRSSDMIIPLKYYIKELNKKEFSFEEVLDLYLKNTHSTLTERKYNLNNRLSPKISGTLCEKSDAIIYSPKKEK